MVCLFFLLSLFCGELFAFELCVFASWFFFLKSSPLDAAHCGCARFVVVVFCLLVSFVCLFVFCSSVSFVVCTATHLPYSTVYNGANGYICNFLGSEAWVQSMKWKYQSDFNNGKRVVWMIDGQIAGYALQSHGLALLTVNNAGRFEGVVCRVSLHSSLELSNSSLSNSSTLNSLSNSSQLFVSPLSPSKHTHTHTHTHTQYALLPSSLTDWYSLVFLGHMVPQDQPEAAANMLSHILGNKPFQ
jgi:Serine carboxypeptidase